MGEIRLLRRPQKEEIIATRKSKVGIPPFNAKFIAQEGWAAHGPKQEEINATHPDTFRTFVARLFSTSVWH